MSRAGKAQLARREINNRVECRCEHRLRCPLQNGMYALVDLCKEACGSATTGMSSSTNPLKMAVTRAARMPWPITSQMKAPAMESVIGKTLKKSPPTAAAGR